MIMVQIWARLFGEGGESVDHLGWLLFCLCFNLVTRWAGGVLGGGGGGCAPPPPPEKTCGFLIQLVFCQKKKAMWFIGVEVEQETSAPPPKKKILDLPLM